MKKALSWSLLIAFAFITWTCQKELHWDDGKADGPASPIEEHYGFSLKENEKETHGCIDTAFYSVENSKNVLNVVATDSAGKKLEITFFSPTANFSSGSYGSATNNATVRYGNYSTSAVNTVFSFDASIINDTLLTGTFSFAVAGTFSNLTTKITNGQIKARIGNRNPC